MEPYVIILNVESKVKALQNTLRLTGQLWETPDEMYGRIIDFAQDHSTCYTNLLNYVGEIKHSQCEYITEDKLVRLGTAIGDLGIAVIQELELIGLYENKNHLTYTYSGLCGNALVIKREKTIFER